MDPSSSAGLLLLAAACAAYFLPSVVAIARLHHNTAAIMALNILLGWSVLGWIIAFVWSLTAKRNP